MGFLSGIFGDGGGTVLLVQAGLLVLPFVLPNKTVEGFFRGVGVVLSKTLRQKIGKDGEKVEKYLQGTVAAAIAGLTAGLDEDDNT